MDTSDVIILHRDQWRDIIRVLKSNMVWKDQREKHSVERAIESMLDQLPDPDKSPESGKKPDLKVIK